MTQKVITFLGLSVAVKNEADPAIVAELRELLDQELKKSGKTIPDGAEIYIKHLSIGFTETHFTVTGLSNRLSHLGVKASIGIRARLQNAITIIDLGCNNHPPVKVKRSLSDVQYTLPESYISKHGKYVDYIAIIVEKGCREHFKKLNIKVFAHATPEFSRRLKNVREGIVISGLRFHLTRDVQFTIF